MIKVFKLIDGSDVISEVNEVNGDTILESPAQIITQPTQQGMSIGLVPFMPFAKGKVTLNEENVVAVSDSNEELENEYRRIFGSGLVLPTKGLA